MLKKKFYIKLKLSLLRVLLFLIGFQTKQMGAKKGVSRQRINLLNDQETDCGNSKGCGFSFRNAEHLVVVIYLWFRQGKPKPPR